MNLIPRLAANVRRVYVLDTAVPATHDLPGTLHNCCNV
jgi:hypothetical protein